MGTPVDLKTFKPGSADELLKGVLGHVAGLLQEKLKQFEKEMVTYLGDLTKASIALAKLINDGTYGARQADLALHSQELLVNNALLRAEFLTYDVAQSILETIFKVIGAAVKNLTGLQLKI